MRQIAGQVARSSVQALGRSRRKRSNQGKWYAGRRVGIPPNRGGGGRQPRVPQMRAQSMPAAYNATVTSSVQPAFTLGKRESTNIGPLKCETGDNGELYWYNINPLSTDLFPILAAQAPNYTMFRFTSLSFEYVPRVGTTANGNVYMGYRPQTTNDDSDFPTVEVIASLQKNATGSVRQGMTFTIPCDSKDRYITPNRGNAQDPLNYNLGTFVMSLQGDNADDVGSLFVRYNIRLTQSKLLTTSGAAWLKLQNTPGTEIVEPGRLGVQVIAPFTVALTSVHPVKMFCAADGATVQVFKNAVEVLPELYQTGPLKSVAVYHVGACRRRDVFTFVSDNMGASPFDLWVF